MRQFLVNEDVIFSTNCWYEESDLLLKGKVVDIINYLFYKRYRVLFTDPISKKEKIRDFDAKSLTVASSLNLEFLHTNSLSL